MNHALVTLLLLLCFSICLGRQHDSSPPSGILATTKHQNKVETPPTVSCPDPADIQPCKCTDRLDDLPEMNCENVQNEEQLRKVFSASFPTTEFYAFLMPNNHGVKTLEDGVFGKVSFQQIHISDGDLQTVETDALSASFSTLIKLRIAYCKLETFPFERLIEFTSLEDLYLYNNNILTLPPLASSSLQEVGLGSNVITHLSPNTFTLLPAVTTIVLSENQLTEIPKGIFSGLPKLHLVDLHRNNISYLQSLTSELDPTNSIAELYLHLNNIEYVEVDAFKVVPDNATIAMSFNSLTRLPEEVWRPVLEKNINLHLLGNDLACGCDLAWLVRDTQLLTTAINARCADGTQLTDLNPADFYICG